MVVGWRGGEEVGQDRAGISDRRPRQTGLSQRAVQIQKGRVYKTLAVSVTQNKRAPRLPPPAPPVLLCAPPQTTKPALLSAASSQQTQPQQQHLHFKLEIDEQDHIRSVGSEPANGTLVFKLQYSTVWNRGYIVVFEIFALKPKTHGINEKICCTLNMGPLTMLFKLTRGKKT